jgi:hypothetical protein
MSLIKSKPQRIFFAVLFSLIAVAALLSVIFCNVLN